MCSPILGIHLCLLTNVLSRLSLFAYLSVDLFAVSLSIQAISFPCLFEVLFPPAFVGIQFSLWGRGHDNLVLFSSLIPRLSYVATSQQTMAADARFARGNEAGWA